MTISVRVPGASTGRTSDASGTRSTVRQDDISASVKKTSAVNAATLLKTLNPSP